MQKFSSFEKNIWKNYSTKIEDLTFDMKLGSNESEIKCNLDYKNWELSFFEDFSTNDLIQTARNPQRTARLPCQYRFINFSNYGA